MSCIVPMKKPKNCYEYGGCPLFDRRYRVCKVAKVDYYDFDKQYADCPLVELPPHGRLIDADELNIRDVSPVDGFCVMGVTEEDIGLAETVIEVEGSET